MLTGLIRAALRFRLLVVLVIAGLCLLELARLPGAHYGVFPEFAPPTIKIATEAPGFGPRGVERAITTPIEQGLFGLRGVTAMRSQSQAGISTVQLVFAGDTQAAADKTRVATRLAGIEAGLPHGVVPVIAPLQSATGTAVEIGLTAPHRSLITLTALADTLVRPALRAVPGVANVVIFGARPPDLAVMVRPSALVRSGYGFNQIARAAGRASTLLGGGFIDTGNQRIDLAIQGQARDAAALRASLVGVADGLPVTLGDVARVQASTPPRFGAALIEGKPGLLLIVSSLRGANTLAVASGVRAALARITPALHSEGVVVLPNALDPAGFIHEALTDLGRVLLVGALKITEQIPT
jgi:Cu/Ag efflux pump CusA